MVAVIRPDDWNLPLLLHVAGAALLVGALAVAAAALVATWKRREPAGVAALTHFSFRMLLLVGVPAYVLMRAGAEWIASKEDVDDEQAWIGVGYLTADIGLLVLLLATIVAGLAARRARRDAGGGVMAGRIAAVLTLTLVAAYVVAIWAMTAKPD